MLPRVIAGAWPLPDGSPSPSHPRPGTLAGCHAYVGRRASQNYSLARKDGGRRKHGTQHRAASSLWGYAETGDLADTPFDENLAVLGSRPAAPPRHHHSTPAPRDAH